MAFEFASTNLVVELGIILALLLAWQFTLAEFVGGPIMIVLLALVFRVLLSPRLVEAARRQADRGRAGSMEGHAAMDMTVAEDGPLWRRVTSPAGFTAISHSFVTDWAAVLRDIVGWVACPRTRSTWGPWSTPVEEPRPARRVQPSSTMPSAITSTTACRGASERERRRISRARLPI